MSERQLRVLHILDHSLPLHSGYAFRSRSIFRAQRSRGWEPIVLTSPKHEAGLDVSSAPDEIIDGVPHRRCGAVPRGPAGINEWRLMRRLEHAIAELVRAHRPDILHAHSPLLNALPALRVGRRFCLPVVYEVRSSWEDAAVDRGTTREGSIRYRATRLLETRACRKADQVVVLCEGLLRDLMGRGIQAEKLTVVGNGVDLDDFEQAAPAREYEADWGLAGKQVIGFAGSFFRWEGLEMLVRAFSRLAARHQDLILLLVGGGDEKASLRRLATELGLDDRVVMPGRLPHARMPEVYALIDILVYARLSNRLTELVTPLKPLEAMAMGKAIVASDVGGHRELITPGATGLLFPAGDSSALADCLEHLLTDSEKRHRLGETGRQWVALHRRWEHTTAPYQSVYERCLGGGSSIQA